MRLLHLISMVVLAPAVMLAQINETDPKSDSSSIASEIKALRDALSAQQKEIEGQRDEIRQLRQLVSGPQDICTTIPGSSPRLLDASLKAEKVPAPDTQSGEKPSTSPLSFRIGGMEFTPGGFVDFENIFRTTNATVGFSGSTTGNPTATNFGNIPFNNQVAGHLTEFKTTAQYSRFSLTVNSKYGGSNLIG